MNFTFMVTPDHIIAAIVIIGVVLFVTWSALSRLWRESRCKHDGKIRETQACQAICNDCGKDLGFIGAVPDFQRRRQ